MVGVLLNLLSLQQDLVLNFRRKTVKLFGVDIDGRHVAVVGGVGRLDGRQRLFERRTPGYHEEKSQVIIGKTHLHMLLKLIMIVA